MDVSRELLGQDGGRKVGKVELAVLPLVEALQNFQDRRVEVKVGRWN